MQQVSKHFLADKEAGKNIICSSSRGPQYLTLTLKVHDGVYAHEDIIEGDKDQKVITSLLRLGKTVKIGEYTFEDLDEVKVIYRNGNDRDGHPSGLPRPYGNDRGRGGRGGRGHRDGQDSGVKIQTPWMVVVVVVVLGETSVEQMLQIHFLEVMHPGLVVAP